MKRFALLVCVLLVGCTSAGDLPASIDQTQAPWQVVDLETGTATPQAALPDLATDPRYRDRLMAFRLVSAVPTSVGQSSGTFAWQDDETRREVRAPSYIGAFEVTRAQWQRLAGASPWTAPAIAAIDGAGGSGEVPATGLGPLAVANAIDGWNDRGQSARLAVPSPAQWEVAARGGQTATYPWGEDHRTSTVRRFAVTWEAGIIDSTSGLQPVGTRHANGLGLYDCIGNAWELTSDGQARGGSWADGVALARPANHRDVPADGWATVGVRLVYLP